MVHKLFMNQELYCVKQYAKVSTKGDLDYL